MKRIILAIVLFLSSTLVYSGTKINLSTQYAYFDVSNLKSLVTEVRRQSKLPIEYTDEFPPGPQYQIEFSYIGTTLELGLSYGYLSSGSRAHYADYTGEYKLDNIINNISYSLIFKTNSVNLKDTNNVLYYAIEGEFGFTESEVKIDEHVRVYEDIVDDSQTFQSTTAFYKFGVGLYYFINNLTFGVSANYLSALEEILPGDWSGFRLGVSIGYYLRL